MKKLKGEQCEYGELDNEYGNDNNMYYYFKKVAEKNGADLDYCFIVAITDNSIDIKSLKKDETIKYIDSDFVWNGDYLARYNDYILVYQP